jgi:hypothetical protein
MIVSACIARRIAMKMSTIREIDETTMVRDIAVGYPRTIAVFQRLGVDYCCGGMTDVTTAAKKSGIAAAGDRPDGAGARKRWNGPCKNAADHFQL